MAKFIKHKPGHNLGDYLHPTKSNALNAPMAKPMQPMKQRVPATPKAPVKMHPKKMMAGKKGSR